MVTEVIGKPTMVIERRILKEAPTGEVTEEMLHKRLLMRMKQTGTSVYHYSYVYRSSVYHTTGMTPPNYCLGRRFVFLET